MSVNLSTMMLSLPDASEKRRSVSFNNKLSKVYYMEPQETLRPDSNRNEAIFLNHPSGKEKQSAQMAMIDAESSSVDMQLAAGRRSNEIETREQVNEHTTDPFVHSAHTRDSIGLNLDRETRMKISNRRISSLNSINHGAAVFVDASETPEVVLQENDDGLVNGRRSSLSTETLRLLKLATGGKRKVPRMNDELNNCSMNGPEQDYNVNREVFAKTDVSPDGAGDASFDSNLSSKQRDTGINPRQPSTPYDTALSRPSGISNEQEPRGKPFASQPMTDGPRSSLYNDIPVVEESALAKKIHAQRHARDTMPHRSYSYAPPGHAYGDNPVAEDLSYIYARPLPQGEIPPAKITPIPPKVAIRESPFAGYPTTPSVLESNVQMVNSSQYGIVSQSQPLGKRSSASVRGKLSDLPPSAVSQQPRKPPDQASNGRRPGSNTHVTQQNWTHGSGTDSLQTLQRNLKVLQKDVAGLKQDASRGASPSFNHSFNSLVQPMSSAAIPYRSSVPQGPFASGALDGGLPRDVTPRLAPDVYSRDFVIGPSVPPTAYAGLTTSYQPKRARLEVQHLSKFKRAKKAIGRLFGTKALVVVSGQPSMNDLKERPDMSIGERIWNTPGRVIGTETGTKQQKDGMLQTKKRPKSKPKGKAKVKPRSKSQKRVAVAKAYRVMAEVRAMEDQDPTPRRPKAKDEAVGDRGEVRAKVRELMSALRWKFTGTAKKSNAKGKRRASPTPSIQLPAGVERGRSFER